KREGSYNMNWKKWSLLLTLVFMLSVILVACGGGNDNADKDNNSGGGDNSGEGELAEEQVFNINIKTEPPSLHPAKATDTTSSAVLDLVVECLTRIKQDTGEPEEAIAEDIDVSDDGLTYTFTIRDDATWTNGDPVTADDFEYAWKWVLDPENADTEYSYQRDAMKGAEAAQTDEGWLDGVGVPAEDEDTLVVELEQPTEYFLDLTALYTFFLIYKYVV